MIPCTATFWLKEFLDRLILLADYAADHPDELLDEHQATAIMLGVPEEVTK